MSDIYSILSTSYASTYQNLIPVGSKFANVDPTQYQGTWTGKDSSHQPFSLRITNVKGYRANVTFTSQSGQQYQRVFITTKNSFRIGDSSFTLTGTGVAQVKTVLTDPTTGTQAIDTSYATKTS